MVRGFLNLVLERSGKSGTSSSMANSFIGYGQRLSGPRSVRSPSSAAARALPMSAS